MIRPLAPFTATLSEAAQLIGAESTNHSELVFHGVAIRDSDVEPGDLFVAIPGSKVHGATYSGNAKSRGAVAVITDRAGAAMVTGLPTLVVGDVRLAAALIAASFYNYPTRDLSSIAITGTNGKTTVSTLLFQIFESAHRDTGLIGTIETRIGADILKSSRTTPEAPDLQGLAAVMRERHMRHLVMEVSSHAIALKRIKGSYFDVAAFTNLTQDHLDFHNDMESYFLAKAQLFTSEYAGKSIINIDSRYGQRLATLATTDVATVSRLNKDADWHFTQIDKTSTGAELRMRGPGGILLESRTQLFGGYNLDNILLAVAIAVDSGIDPIELAVIIPTLIGAPGRLDPVELGQDFKAFVDYAHTPDAVSNVLAAAREFTAGRIIAVLGCGGDRDATKRSLMGQALFEGTDIAIFTSDNPRSENPTAILNQMTEDISFSSPSTIIEDRSEAISYAISQARPEDTVLVLGKGHESGQEVSGKTSAFDDRIHLARAIEGLS